MGESKHIRTIQQVAKYFKETDENTAVTYGAIRFAIDSGYIPYTKSGSRYLIVLEDAIDYFNCDSSLFQGIDGENK
ncbi:MAG: hypothetical protein IJI65_02535 [Lachnospiraceae bacterium]|nr:hypothetical protein [Lachnospiraceae bacterium]